MHLYIEGPELQFFRFNRSMTYWYTMLSPGGAIIANKYLCLKGVRKKFGILGLTRIRPGSDPKFWKKSQPLYEVGKWSEKSRPRGIYSKFHSLSHGETYRTIFEAVLRKKF